MSEQSRKAFEVWAESEGFSLARATKFSLDGYDAPDADYAWLGWQAARQSALEEAAQVAEAEPRVWGPAPDPQKRIAAAIRSLANPAEPEEDVSLDPLEILHREYCGHMGYSLDYRPFGSNWPKPWRARCYTNKWPEMRVPAYGDTALEAVRALVEATTAFRLSAGLSQRPSAKKGPTA